MDQGSMPPEGRRPEENPPQDEMPRGEGQGQGQQPSYPPPGYQPPQGYPPPGYQPPEGDPPQGYPPPGYPPPGAYPPPGYQPPMPVAQKKRFPVWGWVIMGVVGITCVACVGVFVAGGSLIGTAVGIGTTTAQFYTDLQAGQYESAHALLGEELASQYSSSDLQTAWENLAATGPVKFTVGGSGSVENGRAVIPLIFTTSSGTRTVTLTLQQAGKNWKITGADPSLIPEP